MRSNVCSAFSLCSLSWWRTDSLCSGSWCLPSPPCPSTSSTTWTRPATPLMFWPRPQPVSTSSVSMQGNTVTKTQSVAANIVWWYSIFIWQITWKDQYRRWNVKARVTNPDNNVFLCDCGPKPIKGFLWAGVGGGTCLKRSYRVYSVCITRTRRWSALCQCGEAATSTSAEAAKCITGTYKKSSLKKKINMSFSACYV